MSRTTAQPLPHRAAPAAVTLPKGGPGSGPLDLRAHDPQDPRRDAPWAAPGTPEADPRLMGEEPGRRAVSPVASSPS